jgi:hypothetical protein
LSEDRQKYVQGADQIGWKVDGKVGERVTEVTIDAEEFKAVLNFLKEANFRVDPACVIPMRDAFVESGYAQVFPKEWNIRACSAAWCFGFTRGVAMVELRLETYGKEI